MPRCKHRINAEIAHMQRKFGSKRGQVLLMVTLSILPMMGILGLVTDIGYMHFIKMSAQTAAQAAAEAAVGGFHAAIGGSNFTCGVGGVVCADNATDCPSSITTPANALEQGCMYAQAHGFTGANKRVTYQSGTGGTAPTATGSGAASYWVTFRVVQRVPQLFSAVLGNTSGLVAARATSTLKGGADCIFAMDPHQSGSFSVGGTAAVTSSCGIFVDSDAIDALGTNGGGSISAPEYDVVGGVNTHYTLTPTPNTGVSPQPDPLASLSAPASAPYTCTYNNYNPPNWSNPTLNPGVYCGGINVDNNTFTLNPGTYILVGGGLTTQSANSHITGTGVTFYNTFGASSNGNKSYSPINIAANSSVDLRAPTSGNYAGILFFEDRSAPAQNDSYGGGSSAVYEGVIYALHAYLTMYGNSSVSARYTILVADTVSLVGTTGFGNDYSLLPTGSPIQTVTRVE
jgi:hypothetical protein